MVRIWNLPETFKGDVASDSVRNGVRRKEPRARSKMREAESFGNDPAPPSHSKLW